MQVGILPAAPLPGGVKVARRPVKPFGVGASPTLAANFRKAGRYKLAAPVSKTGSALPRSERLDSQFRHESVAPSIAVRYREPWSDAFRQPSTINERKSHEVCSPLPKPVALSQELQTKSCPPHPPGEVEFQLPPGALRIETANQKS